MSDLDQRLRESERPVVTETPVETLQVALQGILARCEEGDLRQKQAGDCLETLRGRVEQLEQITRELAEKQETGQTLPSPPSEQQTSPLQEEQTTTSTATTSPVLESKQEIESLRSFVSERVAGMKDLVSGPLSVIFDAIRSDDFVGEDNFLTFSKAAIYQMFEL